MMQSIGHTADGLLWFVTNDQVQRWIALAVWWGVSAMLTIPARRRLFGQPIYVDDLLFAAWLLTLNRVCFSVQSLVHSDTFGDLTRWFGIGGGVFYTYVVSSYIWPKSVPGLKRA